MRINVAIPEANVSAPVLNAALESVTRLNQSMLEHGEIPTFEQGLQSGVRWKPEPPGDEHFDHAGAVFRRKWGDCDDLAPWLAASLRQSGEDPVATAIVKRSGPKRWHAIVQRGDGTIDDPSKAAGMGQNQPIVGASLPVMYTAPSAVVGGIYTLRPMLAMRGYRDGVQARADVPMLADAIWPEESREDDVTDYAMAAIQAAPGAREALSGAIMGALQMAVVGGYAHPDHIDRLAAIADALDEIPLDEIAELYGRGHAKAASEVLDGFSLRKLARGIVKKAVPVASKLVQFVPGVGPVASSAIDLSAKEAEKQMAKHWDKKKKPHKRYKWRGKKGMLCIPASWI